MNSLKLFIQPRNGLTRKLLSYIKENQPPREFEVVCKALFSGPHGISIPVNKYTTVLMVASGIGIVPQLSYLRSLIRGHNLHRNRTRRIRLVWEMETKGES
jgi:NAD(P)H-flavin reductase